MKIGTHKSFLEPKNAIGHNSAGDPSCVLCMPFDGKNVHTAFDYSCYGNNGIIIGATYRKDEEDWTLFFDGVDDFVNVPHSSSLNITGSITIEGEIYNKGTIINAGLVGKGLRASAYWFELEDNVINESSQFLISVDGIHHVVIFPRGYLNRWVYKVGTYDGKTIKSYVNGEFKAQNTAPSGSIDTNTGSLAIGRNGFNGELYHGLINEVRIYNRAKSATEI